MKKTIVILGVCALLGACYHFGLFELLTFSSIKEKQGDLAQWTSDNYLLSVLGFSAIYIISTALSLPGAALLTLLCGAIYGLFVGTIIASFSSTIGATLAFLGSRFLFRDFVQEKFKNQLTKINEGLEKDGAFYLFTLRLIPVFPFFLVNLVMGLTPIRTFTYYVASQIGMFPGTVVYVNAGTSLRELESLSGILSPKLIFSFMLLGLFPFIAKYIVKLIKNSKQNSTAEKA